MAPIVPQGGRPVAFISGTLTYCLKRYLSVEEESWSNNWSCAPLEKLPERMTFPWVADQHAISYRFDQIHKVKCVNKPTWKIHRNIRKSLSGSLNWLSSIKTNVIGPELKMLRSMSFHDIALQRLIHVTVQICQICTSPSATETVLDYYHFVRRQHLPFSSGKTKDICRNCKWCADIKPQFSSQLPERWSKQFVLGIEWVLTSKVQYEGLILTGWLPSTNTRVFLLCFPENVWPPPPLSTVSHRFSVL